MYIYIYIPKKCQTKIPVWTEQSHFNYACSSWFSLLKKN